MIIEVITTLLYFRRASSTMVGGLWSPYSEDLGPFQCVCRMHSPSPVNQTTDAAPVPTIDSGASLVVYSANDIHHVLMSCGAVNLSWRLTTMINLNRSMDRSVTACCQKEKTVIPLVGAPYVKVACILLLSFTILIFFKRRSSITHYIAVSVIKNFTRTSHLIISIQALLALCSIYSYLLP